jgi:hypothetical protein
MSRSEPITIDPEVEEILRRVASVPGSALLRVSRPRTIYEFLHRDTAVGLAMPSLTAAEHHILQSYRSDIAQFLLEACRRRLISGPGGGVHVSPFQSTAQEQKHADIEDWSARLQAARSEVCGLERHEDAWLLLDRCVSWHRKRSTECA